MQNKHSINKVSCIIIRVTIYLIIGAVFVVASYFGGFTLNKWYLENNLQDEQIKGPYSASNMIVVSLESKSEFGDSAVDTDDDSVESNLAESVSTVFCYSKEIQDVVPAGYTVSISSVNDSNVLKIEVKGEDPYVCVNTVNAIRKIAPEVFERYFHNGTALSFGEDAREANSTQKKETVSPNYYPICFLVGVGMWVLLVFLIEIYLYLSNKKFSVESA